MRPRVTGIDHIRRLPKHHGPAAVHDEYRPRGVNTLALFDRIPWRRKGQCPASRPFRGGRTDLVQEARYSEGDRGGSMIFALQEATVGKEVVGEQNFGLQSVDDLLRVAATQGRRGLLQGTG